MLSVVLLREGKNFGDSFPITKNTPVFKSMNLAHKYLTDRGYVLTPQGYGSPLWVNEERGVWADPVEIAVRDVRKAKAKG